MYGGGGRRNISFLKTGKWKWSSLFSPVQVFKWTLLAARHKNEPRKARGHTDEIPSCSGVPAASSAWVTDCLAGAGPKPCAGNVAEGWGMQPEPEPCRLAVSCVPAQTTEEHVTVTLHRPQVRGSMARASYPEKTMLLLLHVTLPGNSQCFPS